MTQTTYYEFNKVEGTDLVNPLVDTNPNWDALDADLHDFNERSIANCTEVVSLGVHAISRLDTTAKFLKWIATANFTAGDTFVVDGNAVAAANPAGDSLATNAYVSGAVVLACLNSDNSAMTIYVTGTNVASDSARLGGKLPSYYATDEDMTAAETDITNIQALQGNTSIVGIGDGTLTGAVSSLDTEVTNVKVAITANDYTLNDVTKYLSSLIADMLNQIGTPTTNLFVNYHISAIDGDYAGFAQITPLGDAYGYCTNFGAQYAYNWSRANGVANPTLYRINSTPI